MKKIRIGKKLVFLFTVVILLLLYLIYRFSFSDYFSKTTKLTFGVFSGSMYDVPNMQSYKIIDEAIAAFEKDNKNIQIEYQYGILKSDYSEWLSQKILKGKMPDVYVVMEKDFNTLSSIGALKNLELFIDSDKIFDSRKFYEQAINSGKFKDKLYALPIEVDPVLLFVNKTLLKKEGIKINKENWTWNEFYDICKQVTKDTDNDGVIDQFGVINFNWEDAVYTNGQTLFTVNGEKSKFSKEGVVESIKFVKKLHELNNRTKVTDSDFNDGNVLFKPFPFSWYRVYSSYPYKLIRYADFEWECIKLPRGPKGKNASELKSFLLGISSKTKHPDEAWKFLKFLTNNPETQMDVFKYSHGVPVLKIVTESNRADEELKKYNPEKEVSIDRKILSEIIEDSIVTPKFRNYEKAMKLADLNITQIINRNKDIENSLIKLDKELYEFLNK